jgi:hypothetical protein
MECSGSLAHQGSESPAPPDIVSAAEMVLRSAFDVRSTPVGDGPVKPPAQETIGSASSLGLVG